MPDSEANDSDSGFSPEPEVVEHYRSLPRALVLLVLREMVSRGLIDPGRIDEPEYLWPTILTHHNEIVPDIEMQVAIHDYFLDVAKYAIDTEQPAVAVVLVATAIEHILNLHYRDLLTRKGLDEKEIKAVIRGCSMEAKTGWLMALVGLPPLANDLKKRIARVVELRNCVVHYKAQPTRLGAFEGGWDRLKQRLDELDYDDLLDLPDDLEDVMSCALINTDRDLQLAVKVYQTAIEERQ